MRRLMAVLVAALVLVAAACGNDDGSGGSSNDDLTAASALLTIDDFAPGWSTREADPEGDAQDAALRARITSEAPQCEGVQALIDETDLPGESADADSPTFVAPDGNEVNERVVLFTSDDAASAALSRFGEQAYRECLAAYFPEAVRAAFEAAPTSPDVESVIVDVAEVPAVDAGDASGAVQAAVTIEGPDGRLDYVAEAQVVRVGRGLAQLSTVSFADPFGPGEQERLLLLATERLADALGS